MSSYATLITPGGPGGSFRYLLPRDVDRYFGVDLRPELLSMDRHPNTSSFPRRREPSAGTGEPRCNVREMDPAFGGG
jgi:hypothetical protein